jgi:GNAT superfamily N-acetyltransferase
MRPSTMCQLWPAFTLWLSEKSTAAAGRPIKTREWQWPEAFAKTDGSWFCFVIERRTGDLIGFAKGVPYTGGLPGFAGELNKIYLLREYQRMGLGRRLIGHVAREFLGRGISSICCSATLGIHPMRSTRPWERNGYSPTRASFTATTAGEICGVSRTFAPSNERTSQWHSINSQPEPQNL